MYKVRSFVGGEWVGGDDASIALLNPATEEEIGTVETGGVNTAEALKYAREVGGPALRAMSFKERGQLLLDLSSVIHGSREELFEMAMLNGGNTRKDAKFDIDGAWQTMGYYGNLGLDMGEQRYLVDGEDIPLGRNPRWCGRHVFLPRHGAAVHVNAFNFPAWGFAEKAATAILAGMPVVSKPATSTSLVAHRITELFAESGKLPAGVFSMIVGGGRDLMEHAESQDVVAFTGGSDTARVFRASDSVTAKNVKLTIEADSLNAAIAGPDLGDSPDLFTQFVTDVFRDMTQKTGQKCTAIRRIFVPEHLLGEVKEALIEMLQTIQTGDTRQDGVSMGPLVSSRQQKSVLDGITRLKNAGVTVAWSGKEKERPGVDAGKGFFVEPHLFEADTSMDEAVHGDEIFGPVSTLLPYNGETDELVRALNRGGGSLVASVYSDERAFVQDLVLGTATHHGRLYLCSSKTRDLGAGPGTVLPMMVHGGPGRAGGGEELGGLRGVEHYMQRTAIQGYRPLLERLFNGE